VHFKMPQVNFFPLKIFINIKPIKQNVCFVVNRMDESPSISSKLSSRLGVPYTDQSTAGSSKSGIYSKVFYLTLTSNFLHPFLAFTGIETKNKYNIKNSLGQQVYYAEEDTDCWTRNCCGSIRPLGMKIFDNFKNEVIHLYRPLACDNCCFPCCLQVRIIQFVFFLSKFG
jgi:hypothetical protein